MKLLRVIMPLAALFAAGCAGYSWTSPVPECLRTVAVPTFVNASDVTGLGDVVARQVLREIQREGTFRIAPAGDSAVEVQGRVVSGDSHVIAYERSTGVRNREHRFSVVAEVSFIDKLDGKVLVDNRKYRATTTFLASSDVMTAERDASGRIAEDLARQIVDDLLTIGD